MIELNEFNSNCACHDTMTYWPVSNGSDYVGKSIRYVPRPSLMDWICERLDHPLHFPESPALATKCICGRPWCRRPEPGEIVQYTPRFRATWWCRWWHPYSIIFPWNVSYAVCLRCEGRV